MSSPVLLIYCTCPADGTAERLAEALVTSGTAACVSIGPIQRSVYRWLDELEISEEVLLMIKTTETAYPSLESAIGAMHPYEVPEIIAVPVTHGLPGYLEWVIECTKKP
jgi:periplasmic divalent cation tolerance protein